MIITTNLLYKYCSKLKSVPLEVLLKTFDQIGIEVDYVKHHPQNEKLQYCKILNLKKHPNADRLTLVELSTNKGIIEVICGADNLSVNKYVIYAPVGTSLWNGLTLSEKVIKGISSAGMICAYNELTNINSNKIAISEYDGILIFDNPLKENETITKKIGLDDIILDLAIPSNRNDLNSLMGILQELSAPLNLEFDLPFEFKFDNSNFIDLDSNQDEISMNCFIKIKHQEFKKLHFNEQEILISCGYQIKNTIEDEINFLNLYTGNALEIYNGDLLTENKLIITNPKISEILIEDKLFETSPLLLALIQDDKIINYLGVGVNDYYKFDVNSKTSIIHICNFNHHYIRKVLKLTKFNSKLNTYFTKKVSLWNLENSVFQVINFFTNKNCFISSQLDLSKIEEKIIHLNYQNLNEFIGIELTENFIRNNFLKMNYKIEGNLVKVHPARLDLDNEFDLFEEALKFININDLEPMPIDFKVLNFAVDFKSQQINKIQTFLVNHGFIETKTYNLTSINNLNDFNFKKIPLSSKLSNSISKQRIVLRNNLITQMLEVLKYNVVRKRDLRNIFEIQTIHLNEKDTFQNLVILLSVPFIKKGLFNNAINLNLATISSFLKQLFSELNLSLNFSYEKHDFENLNNKTIITLWNDLDQIGYLSEIKTDYLKNMKLNNEHIFMIDLNLNNLIKPVLKKVMPISKSPLIFKNFTFSKNENFLMEDLINKLLKIPTVKDIKIVDIFKKENELISYSIKVTINKLDITLTTIEINKILELINEIILDYN